VVHAFDDAAAETSTSGAKESGITRIIAIARGERGELQPRGPVRTRCASRLARQAA
jgi:hypothetical protein